VARRQRFSIDLLAGADHVRKLVITGEVDMASGKELEQAVASALTAGATEIDVDLSSVSFIDSTGLRTILELDSQAQAGGWLFRVVSPSPPVATLLEMTGLSSELTVANETSSWGETANASGQGTLELKLARDQNAPGAARSATREWSESIGLTDPLAETLLLLVSEVVTNAVVHSKAPPNSPISFRADADRERIRVDVHDGGPGFSKPPRSEPPPPGGWGLHLVDRKARNWGVQASNGTLVWFELALNSAG
jgi:anti-anti-sigma factor